MFKSPKECEKAFYRAFINADLSLMSKVWGKLPEMRCIHPRGVALMGRERILSSFKRLFDGVDQLSVALVDRGWIQNSMIAIHSLEEHIGVRDEGSQGKTICTNIYTREDSGLWVMVLHHASPLPRPRADKEHPVDESRPTLH